MESQIDSEHKTQDSTRIEKRLIATPHRRQKPQHIKSKIEEIVPTQADSKLNVDKAPEEIEEVTKIPLKLCPSCKKKKNRAKQMQLDEAWLDELVPMEDLLIFGSSADEKKERNSSAKHSPSLAGSRPKSHVRRVKADNDLESHPYHNSNNSIAMEIEFVTVKGQKGSKKLFAVKQS